MGTLNDILNAKYSRKECIGYRCIEREIWQLVHQINCNVTENQLYYKDCKNSSSLSFLIEYSGGKTYPNFYCSANTFNKTCASSCAQFSKSEDQLFLIQDFNGKIEPAWTGLSNCGQANIQLSYEIKSCAYYPYF